MSARALVDELGAEQDPGVAVARLVDLACIALERATDRSRTGTSWGEQAFAVMGTEALVERVRRWRGRLILNLDLDEDQCRA